MLRSVVLVAVTTMSSEIWEVRVNEKKKKKTRTNFRFRSFVVSADALGWASRADGNSSRGRAEKVGVVYDGTKVWEMRIGRLFLKSGKGRQ